jgi:ATP-dependent Clp protease ATP-binding subunit ClpC
VLDELEKASDALPQVLLPALEEGAVTLKNGMVTSFANTIVIATSNVGAQEMSAAVRPNFGFSPSSGPAEKTSQMVESAALAGLKQRFQHMPEFLGRFTDTIVFMPHGEAELLQILDLAIADKNEHFRENHGVEICLTSKARHHILRRITPERHLGARPLKQAIRDMVEWPFSGYLSAGHLQGGKRLIACLEDELNGSAGTPQESRLAFFVADAPDLAQYATKPLLQIAAAPHEGDTTIIPDVQVEPERSDLA